MLTSLEEFLELPHHDWSSHVNGTTSITAHRRVLTHGSNEQNVGPASKNVSWVTERDLRRLLTPQMKGTLSTHRRRLESLLGRNIHEWTDWSASE